MADIHQLYCACLNITKQGVTALTSIATQAPSQQDQTLLWTFITLQDQVNALGTLNDCVAQKRLSLLTSLQNAQVEEAAAYRRIKLMQSRIADAEKVPRENLKALFSELSETPVPEDPQTTMELLKDEDTLRAERAKVLADLERQSATLADELNKLKAMESRLLPTFEPIFKQYETHANANFGTVGRIF